MRVPPSRRAQHALDAMAHIGKFMGDLTYDEFKNDELVLSAVKLKLPPWPRPYTGCPRLFNAI